MDTEHESPWGLDPLIDITELAAYLGVPVGTVYDWRTSGKGPRAHRIGKHLKSAVSDVRIWVEQQREGEGTLMARPRLDIGTFGGLWFDTETSGRVVARTRYRDWDGRRRLVQASGSSEKAAERALKKKLAERSLFQPAAGVLTPDSGFGELVDYWLEQLDLEGHLSKTTRQLYERNMRTLVMPVFRELTLREIGVARCDHFLKQQAKRSYNRAKQSRVVLRLAFALAVRHEILPRNPMGGVSRLRRPPSTPSALSPAEVNAIRAAIVTWEAGRLGEPGPRPDGQLGAIVEVMLGTSARIGEVLALRRCDVDVTGRRPRCGSPARSWPTAASRFSGRITPRPRSRGVRSRSRRSPPRRSANDSCG